ncbi:MAG: hypothetical protein SGI74_05125 [Oligoflexia bacterium]|nr:hypothetical protein [Oligoflexia bacterium]
MKQFMIASLFIFGMSEMAKAEPPSQSNYKAQQQARIRLLLERERLEEVTPRETSLPEKVSRVDFTEGIPSITHKDQTVIDRRTGQIGKISRLFENRDKNNTADNYDDIYSTHGNSVEVKFTDSEFKSPRSTYRYLEIDMTEISKFTEEHDSGLKIDTAVLLRTKEGGLKVASVKLLFDKGEVLLEMDDDKSQKPARYNFERKNGNLSIDFYDFPKQKTKKKTSHFDLTDELVLEVETFTTSNDVIYKKGESIKTKEGAVGQIQYIFKDGTVAITFENNLHKTGTNIIEKLSASHSNASHAALKAWEQLQKNQAAYPKDKNPFNNFAQATNDKPAQTTKPSGAGVPIKPAPKAERAK